LLRHADVKASKRGGGPGFESRVEQFQTTLFIYRNVPYLHMSLNFSSDKIGLVAVVSAVLLFAAPAASEVQINDPDGMTLMQGAFNMDGNSLTNVESISSDGGSGNLEKTIKVNNGLKLENNALFMDNNNIANAGRITVVNGPTISGYGISMSGGPNSNLMDVENLRMTGEAEIYDAEVLEFNPGGEILNLGSCSGSGCDIAENVEQAEGADLEKGDIVSIGPKGKLVKADEEYDSEVAGVVSSSPVIRMGTETGSLDLGGSFDENTTTVVETDSGKEKVPLALAGLVPVKASAANGAIEPGDKLTTSGIAGHAVKAEPLIERDGRELYGSGIIGKAMEPLESGKGKIQMLASIE
jgi:hypothetical protein